MLVAVAGQGNMQVYAEELDKLANQQRAVKNDDEFIRKMHKFNRFVDDKKQQYQAQAQQRPRSSTNPDVQLASDQPFSEQSLQKKNLNQIYGRVR